jgi:putative DNA primase/helicase
MSENLFRYHDDLSSLRQIVAQADPDRRLAAYSSICREAIRWNTVGGLEKVDVVDDLHEIGVDNDLAEDDIQAALAEAVERPFDPSKITSSISWNGSERSRSNGYMGTSSAELVIRRAADIEPEPIRWLWPDRIAIGKLSLLAGEPGLGKSQLTCVFTAAVTTGGMWPGDGGNTAPLGSAIILSAEDDAADTIRPRLDAAGADAGRVFIISAVKGENGKGHRSFNLQADLALLEKQITQIGDVRLVVIDPVSSYLGKVDSHRNAELRAVLEPIGEMSSRLGVATLAVTHLNKGGGTSANNRFIGSIAFVAAARAAFIVTRDPEDKDRRLLLPTKNNLGPDGIGLGFRIGQVETPSGILAPTVFFDTMPVTMSADEVLAASGASGSAPARSEAEDFLREILADGAVPTRRILSEAKAAGLSWATVRRAKETLGVRAAKTALDGGWAWSLPEDAHR